MDYPINMEKVKFADLDYFGMISVPKHPNVQSGLTRNKLNLCKWEYIMLLPQKKKGKYCWWIKAHIYICFSFLYPNTINSLHCHVENTYSEERREKIMQVEKTERMQFKWVWNIFDGNLISKLYPCSQLS